MVYSYIVKPFLFLMLGTVFWSLRSWNLEIGDGLFCCKQTAGDSIFETTLSRSFLSYLLYRFLFFNLHPMLNWWVEDVIALSSCAAGILYFWALFRLSEESARNLFGRYIIVLFPSTTLLFQVFCGHIEFYPWTNAFLMLFVYLSWKSIYQNSSPFYASIALALAAGFHSSGVFYFPALLFLPFLKLKKDGEISWGKKDIQNMVIIFILYIITAMVHRINELNLPIYVSEIPVYQLHLPIWFLAVPFYFALVSAEKRAQLAPYMMVYVPWFALFSIRSILNLKAEPLIEHLPPFMEPYDHGAYLYMAFSWEHLYDKTMFHIWLAPFALLTILIIGIWKWKLLLQNRWLLFLGHMCIWTMVWTVLFYPQLRTRDWDLFATMSIPFNLMALYLALQYFPLITQRILIPIAVVVQLCISLPIIFDNSNVMNGRGYATLSFESAPVSADVYVRSLKLKQSPLVQPNVRSGLADVRMIPTERDYLSWSEEVDIQPGQEYVFKAEFDPR